MPTSKNKKISKNIKLKKYKIAKKKIVKEKNLAKSKKKNDSKLLSRSKKKHNIRKKITKKKSLVNKQKKEFIKKDKKKLSPQFDDLLKGIVTKLIQKNKVDGIYTKNKIEKSIPKKFRLTENITKIEEFLNIFFQ